MISRGNYKKGCFFVAAAYLFTGCAPVTIYQPPEKPRELVAGLVPATIADVGWENHVRLTKAPSRFPAPAGCTTDADGNWISTKIGKNGKPEDCAGYRKPTGGPIAEEWDWNKTPGEPPRLCLAMSGGGLRSGTFNLGILKGLHHAGLLQEIDVASSVSGGGYTLSWYVAQKYFAWLDAQGRNPPGDAALFELAGPYQRHLRNNSDFYSTFRGLPAFGLALFPGVPLNLLANGVFGLHANTNIFYDSYTDRVRELLHSRPPRVGQAPTPPAMAGIDILDLQDFMRTAPRSARPPLFVLNTTALLDAALQQPAGLLQNSVFEFTPLQFGSDAFGRYKYAGTDGALSGGDQLRWRLDELVTLSGAALDFNQLVTHPSSRQAATAFNLDLGRYIPNPRHTRSLEQNAWRLTPFAHWFGRPHYARDADGSHIYLSDGGHSENLGAFSLIRRMCSRIIIVDGEEDSAYAFGAYFKLKSAIENEMGVRVKVDTIEALRPRSCTNVTCEITGEHEEFPDKSPIWHAVGKNPVMSGSIGLLPYCKSESKPTGAAACRVLRPGTIDVHYVKLAYTPDVAIAADCVPGQASAACLEKSLLDTYRATGGCIGAVCNPRSSTPFPQLPTSKQDMPSEHFDSYRNLGCRIALTHLAVELGQAARTPTQVADLCLH